MFNDTAIKYNTPPKSNCQINSVVSASLFNMWLTYREKRGTFKIFKI